MDPGTAGGPPAARPGSYVYGWGFGYRGWLWDPWVSDPTLALGPPGVVAPYGIAVSPEEYPPPSPAVAVDQDGLPLEPERSVRRTIFSISGYGQTVSGQAPARGSAFGLGLGVEGEHWGLLGQWNGFDLASLTGPGTDNVNVVHLQVTYAVLSGERGRLRLHLGASAAFAPDLSRVGPSVGASVALGLLGPLGVEGQVSYTPTPFTELDAFAGLSVGWASFALRGGYHWTYLDDQGLVDGVSHSERYQGPWIGFGLAL